MVARSHLVIFASAFAHLDKCKLPFLQTEWFL